ncbi:heterokaryon incompatibility protein-domain-containing protein [Phaeosphaeriaceae sp. PMI808]|nr:heterokaryon incompatibility protein-domain-containing protein [Phaeosphaeriaceae sp. PMI808]
MIPYQTINPELETRVLRIAPPNNPDDKDIVCSLEHASLSSPVEYEALSYVWSKSINGRIADIDPETEIAGQNINALGVSKTMIRGKIKDLYDHPTLKHVMFSSGIPRPKGCIVVNGVKVEVGGELLSVLRRLRRLWAPSGNSDVNSGGIAVWIDALCINQDDIEERNKHVTKMGEIYRKAKVVRIWLGEEVSGAERIAFNALNEILRVLNDMHKAQAVEDDWKRQMYWYNDPRVSNIQWSCLSSILSRNWFQRTWVIQEIGFAQQATVHLGSLSCGWKSLSAAILMLRELDLDTFLWASQEFTADTTIALMEKLNCTQRGPQKNSYFNSHVTLLEILHESRAFHCTVKSDKVYGVLGLACDASEYPTPDYSLPATEVFKSVATTHIARTNSLAILYHCSGNYSNEELGLPSWAPDWTQKCHHRPLYLTSLKSQAAGRSEPVIEICGNVLKTRGRIVRTISAVDLIRDIPRNSSSTPKPADKIFEPSGEREYPVFIGPDIRQTEAEDWATQRQENTKNYISNIMKMAFPQGMISVKVFENLWRTFVCNQTIEGENPPAEWGIEFSYFVSSLTNYEKDRGEWMEDVLREGRTGRRSGGQESSKWDLTEEFETHTGNGFNQYYEFVKANGMWCYNRRFFKCDEGEFGWGPDGVQDGDVVAVINGLGVPIVLRPVSAGFKVVGDCYCHGLMQGEGMDIAEQQDIHLV